MSDFSNRIKDLRKAAGMTQKQMADLLGLKNERTYRQYESGEIDVSTSKLIFLADYFNVSADYILGRSEIPNILTSTEEARILGDIKKMAKMVGDIKEVAENLLSPIQKILESNQENSD